MIDLSKYGATVTPAPQTTNQLDFSKYGATVTPPQQSGVPETKPSPKVGALDFLGGVPALENKIPGMEGFAKGVAKSFGSTLQGVLDIGGKIANVGRKVFGAEPQPAPQLPAFMTTPQGKAEEVGKFAGDVGQFFVPGGTELKAGTAIDKAVDVAKFAEKFGPEAGKVLDGILKTLGRGAVTGASTAAVTAAQTGGDIEQTKTAGLIGATAGALGKVLETVGPTLAKNLQISDFKLSPSQEAKAAHKAETAAQFMTSNKILGSETAKYQKLDTLNQNLESTLQSSLPKDIGVPKSSIIDNINSNLEKIKVDDPAVYNSAKSEAQKAIDLLNSTKGNYIKVEDVLKSKRSWASLAFKTTKFAVKDPRVSAEGAYAAELGFQKALSDVMEISKSKITVPQNLQGYFGGKGEVSLSEFNKVYSDAITSKNLTYLAQFKKDSGLVGRLFSLWVGSAVGEAIVPGLGGKLAGATVGELSSTRLPGFFRSAGERIGSAGSTAIVAPTKATLGTMLNRPENPEQQQ